MTFDNSLDNNQRDISLSIILDKEQHFLQDFSHHFTKAHLTINKEVYSFKPLVFKQHSSLDLFKENDSSLLFFIITNIV